MARVLNIKSRFCKVVTLQEINHSLSSVGYRSLTSIYY